MTDDVRFDPPTTRPRGEWPRWIDDVLAFGPIAELETQWKAAIGDAIVGVLDQRAHYMRALDAFSTIIDPDDMESSDG
jgi:hypothetical protein